MNSLAIEGYRSVDARNLRGGYQKPFVVTTQILDHRNGHYVKPNKVALKYFDFKKDVDPDAHVKMFNSEIKTNIKTSKKHIIDAFSYMLRDTTSNWCQNYMSEFPKYVFLELTQAFYKRH
jgi:transcription elongation factor GreA-like protein